jgi:hypothetical protein
LPFSRFREIWIAFPSVFPGTRIALLNVHLKFRRLKMSDDTNKIDEKAAAPAISADSTELTEDSLKNVAGGTEAQPKESVSFNFTKIEIKYQQQRPE